MIRVLRTFGSVLAGIALIAMAGAEAAAARDEPASAPPLFACKIRYHFRERLEGVKPGGKQYSTPSHEQEALPAARLAVSDGQAARLVEGRAAHLPYRFVVKLKRKSGTGDRTLDVNIVDTTGKPLLGYPQTVESPFGDDATPTAKNFEIPIAAELKNSIEKTLLAKNQHLTHVELIVAPSP